MINLNIFETVIGGLVIQTLEATVNLRQIPMSVFCILVNYQIIRRVLPCSLT